MSRYPWSRALLCERVSMDNHDVKYSSLPDLSSQSFLVSECLSAVFNLYKLIKFQTIIGFSSLISCVSCDLVEVLLNSMEYISVNCDQCGRLSSCILCSPRYKYIFLVVLSAVWWKHDLNVIQYWYRSIYSELHDVVHVWHNKQSGPWGEHIDYL